MLLPAPPAHRFRPMVCSGRHPVPWDHGLAYLPTPAPPPCFAACAVQVPAARGGGEWQRGEGVVPMQRVAGRQRVRGIPRWGGDGYTRRGEGLDAQAVADMSES